MEPGPSTAAEFIAGILIPPACREEVLGDLHERFQSPAQYAFDAMYTIPFVILSRVRRTSDPQVVLMQAFGLYLAFLGAAWFLDGDLLHTQWGLLALAIPAGAIVVGIMLEDAYARPGRRSGYGLARGPAFGVALAFLTQMKDLALPRMVLLCGCGLGLLLSCAVRMLFPPASNQMLGVNAPAYWLERSGGEMPPVLIRILQGIAAVFSIGAAGAWIADRAALPLPQVVGVLALFAAVFALLRRS
ncbi:MAG TPA: hypothetical protein VGL53_21985 [Bryobacteraceae bacterium]|jgi:hypothetical protein